MLRIAARPILARMLVIDQELRDGSWPNARTLSRRLEVTDRTIRRDIDYMRDQLHAPIAFDARKHGYYYSEVSFEVTHLREAERLVLSWAPDCEALEPAELRNAIRNACARAARSHGPAGGKPKPNSARK